MTGSGASYDRNDASVVRVDDLTVRFAGRPIIECFCLRVSKGEKVTVTGRSGSGKSTLLRCLEGFVIPWSGSITIKEEKVADTTIWGLRRLMAYVPQEPELGAGNVRAVLEQPFDYRTNHALRGNLALIPDLFDRFLLSAALLDQETSKLSGGEKQRIAVIGALLLQRELLLLDEAASALDEKSRLELADYLKSQEDLTILSVAHDPGDLPLAGPVVLL